LGRLSNYFGTSHYSYGIILCCCGTDAKKAHAFSSAIADSRESDNIEDNGNFGKRFLASKKNRLVDEVIGGFWMLVFNHYQIRFSKVPDSFDDLLSGYASIVYIDRMSGGFHV
jgi:hypothetical protein